MARKRESATTTAPHATKRSKTAPKSSAVAVVSVTAVAPASPVTTLVVPAPAAKKRKSAALPRVGVRTSSRICVRGGDTEASALAPAAAGPALPKKAAGYLRGAKAAVDEGKGATDPDGEEMVDLSAQDPSILALARPANEAPSACPPPPLG